MLGSEALGAHCHSFGQRSSVPKFLMFSRRIRSSNHLVHECTKFSVQTISSPSFLLYERTIQVIACWNGGLGLRGRRMKDPTIWFVFHCQTGDLCYPNLRWGELLLHSWSLRTLLYSCDPHYWVDASDQIRVLKISSIWHIKMLKQIARKTDSWSFNDICIHFMITKFDLSTTW